MLSRSLAPRQLPAIYQVEGSYHVTKLVPLKVLIAKYRSTFI